MISDRFRIHLISGDSMLRNQPKTGRPTDQRQALKYAVFYLVVAAILVVINNTAKAPMAGAVQPESEVNPQIYLSVTHKLERNRLVSNSTAMGAYVVRFRLANQGNQPIFYPVFSGTNHPVGQTVYRITPEVD